MLVTSFGVAGLYHGTKRGYFTIVSPEYFRGLAAALMIRRDVRMFFQTKVGLGVFVGLESLMPSFMHRLISLNRTSLGCPVHPAPRILANICPPRLPRQSCGRPAAHTSLAVKHNFRLLARSRVPKSVLEFFVRDIKAVRC